MNQSTKPIKKIEKRLRATTFAIITIWRAITQYWGKKYFEKNIFPIFGSLIKLSSTVLEDYIDNLRPLTIQNMI